MSARRIFFIYYHDADFVPIHAAEMISAMQQEGYSVTVFTSFRRNLQNTGTTFNPGIRVFNIRTPRVRFFPELIFMAMLLPVLTVAAAFMRPRLIYARHSAVSIAASFAAKLTFTRCFLEINDIPFDKLRFSGASAAKLRWVDLYHRIAFKLAGTLLPVTPQIGQWCATQYRVDASRITVIPNGVNTVRFTPRDKTACRKKYGIDVSVPCILSLGSLFPWAGLETLIDAAPSVLALFPSTLFLIGSCEEPYLSQVKNKVADSGLEHVFRFFGFIPWDEASWFIGCADICAAPFIFKDTRSGVCSLRVLSYFACGRPVVGSDIPGLGDILEQEHIGRSFPMGKAPQLGTSLRELLSDMPGLQKMGDTACNYADQHHSWSRLAQKILSLTSTEHA
jgi:glycosyltransferase involved in cell wall biosynthesis